jgi:hypothetical protein
MKTNISRRCFLVSSAGAVLAVGKPSSNEVTLLRTPNGGLQPQAIVDSSGIIHLVYLYGDPAAADIGYVRKAPNEEEFSSPIRVNDRPGSAIALGTVRGAHLALGKSGRVHVAWNGSSKAEPKGPRKAIPMLYTRLDNSGKSFEPQRNLMNTATGLDGGGAIAADARGNVYVTCHAQGQSNGQPIEGEGHRRVLLARSVNDGKTFDPETPVSPSDAGACGCCGMGALADRKGNLYLLYRSAREVVHRDMYLLISRDRGKTFQTAEVQPWEIGACPMSTVSLVQADQQVLLSWETNNQVYFAEVDSRTASLGDRIAAPGPGIDRKHPAVAVNRAGQILLCWTEGTGWKKGGSLAWQLFNSDTRPLAADGKSPVVPAWGLPTAVAVGNQFFAIC